MGWFKIRQNLYVAGGSVDIGANNNWYRSASLKMKTDSSLIVGGTAFVAPYGTAAPTPDTNGAILVYHKTHVPRLVVYSGGTAYSMAFPGATHGTVTITVGSPP
jgi:hypothetical protein